MNSFLKYLLLAEGFAVTTFGLGWWSVPIVAAFWGMASADRFRARNAALCASVGWATLLLIDAARGPVAVMASQLAGVMRVPAPVLYLATLIFPAILAWSAAALVPSLARDRSKAVIADPG